MASIKLQGDNSGTLTIEAPSDAGNNTITLPATTQTLATQNALGVRNLIINGDMRVAQRGTSATGLSNGNTGYHTVDRWKFQHTGTITYAVTMSQDTDVPSGEGFSNSVKYDITTAQSSLAAGDSLLFSHYFEGQMLQHLKKGTANAESVTLSFWVKSNKTGTYIVELLDADNTRQISKSYTIDSADTWEKKSLTFAGDTTGAFVNDNNTSLALIWWLGAGTDFTSGTLQTSWGTMVNTNRAVGVTNLADSTSNYINITGVQLEVGDTATPFEHRPYDMELQRCMRYYEQMDHDYPGIAAGTKGPASAYSLFFKVKKRATPSMSDVTLRNAANGNTTTVAASGSNWTHENAARYATSGTTGNTGDGMHIYSATGIQADAEL